MNNKIKIFSGLMILLCGFIFMGCEELAEEIDCYDKWYEYDVDYQVGSGSVELECYLIYTTDDYSNSKIKADINFTPGLNLVVIPDAEADSDLVNMLIDNFSAGSYVFKSWSSDENLDEEDSKLKFKMSKAKWAAIYLKMKSSEKFDSRDDTPPDALKKSSAKALEINAENFTWKTLLRSLLLSYL